MTFLICFSISWGLFLLVFVFDWQFPIIIIRYTSHLSNVCHYLNLDFSTRPNLWSTNEEHTHKQWHTLTIALWWLIYTAQFLSPLSVSNLKKVIFFFIHWHKFIHWIGGKIKYWPIFVVFLLFHFENS